MANNYKYSRTHTISTTYSDLNAPYVPDIFKELAFTIVLRNKGSNDCSVFLKGENGSIIEHFLPANKNGILLQHVPWEHISSGLDGQSLLGSTNVLVVIQSQVDLRSNVNVNLPTPITNALLQSLGIDIGITPISDEIDDRDLNLVVV
jgi:hypothetical protein